MRADAPLGRQLASNTLHAVSGRLAMLLVWLVLVPRILRALGPERFAIWSLFFALTGYLGAFDFGLTQGTLRHVSAARAGGREGEGGSFATLAALGFLGLGLVWLAIALCWSNTLLGMVGVPPELWETARFVMLAGTAVFVLAGLANLMQAVLQAYDRFDLANFITITIAVQQAIGIVVVLGAGWGVEGLVMNTGLGWLIGVVAGAQQIRRVARGFHWSSPARGMTRFGEAVRFGSPLQISNACAVAHVQLDKFLLARLVALAAVTPYELGSRVVMAAFAIPQLLVLAVLPVASALHALQDPGRLAELYRRGNRYVLTSAAVAMAATLGASGRLYLVWLGPGHAEATLALRGLTFTAVAALAAGIGVAVARGIGRTDLEAWSSVTVIAIHLGLSLWLVPVWGLAGALVAIFVSSVVGTIVLVWRLAGVLEWPRFGTLLEPLGIPLLAAGCGTGLAWVVDRALPGGSGAGEWAALAAVAASGALGAAAVSLVTGYVRWREATGLIGGGFLPAR